jgi:prolycopene isomerase
MKEAITLEYDAIIIGSGMGGLTTGALLSQAGKKVLVLEQHYEIGGCASMFRRRQFRYDVAIRLISGCEPGGELYNLYDKLGLLDKIEFIEVNPMYSLKFENTVYEVPANLDELNRKMVEWFPEDGEAITETISEIKQIGQALMNESFQKDPKLLQRVIALNNMSFADYLANRFRHPHSALLLSSLHFYAGVNLQQLPTLFMMNVMMSYHNGAFYPKGGSQKLTHVLRDYIQSHNGDVLVKRKVEKILYSGSRVQGVIDQKGNEYFAPVVISNADLTLTMKKLLGEEHLPPLYRESLAKLEPSHSAVILYAALKKEGIVKTLPHELFLSPAYESLLDDEQYLYQPDNLDSDPFISVSCPSVVESSLAPKDHVVIAVTALTSAKHVQGIDKKTLEQKFIHLLNKKLPGLTKQIVGYELATPSTITKFTLSRQGAIFGWGKSKHQRWMAKMGPNTPIQGLYLTGQWTPQIHGVYGTTRSGRKTFEYIINNNS